MRQLLSQAAPRVLVPAGDLMAAESMLSLRGSSANLRKSQWSLRGETLAVCGAFNVKG